MSSYNNKQNSSQSNADNIKPSANQQYNNADAGIKIENPELALAAAQIDQQPIETKPVQQQPIVSKVQDASAFGKVAVVYGGNSNERSVSLDSGAAVLLALQNQGVDATHFDPKHQQISELMAYDRVFNVLHGRGGEDGVLQGMLQWLDIPQTGSGI